MSTIRKTPYVETLVSGLSSADKVTLLGLVNGTGTNVAASISNLPADNVKAVNFEFDNGEIKSALYVHTTNNTALLCYHRFQDLLVLEIDSNHNINKINEYCDINELRRILTESTGGGVVYTAGNGIDITGTTISVGDDLTIDNYFANDEIEFTDSTGDFGTNAKARIAAAAGSPEGTSVKSTNETEGKVLTTDGNGAASWEMIEIDETNIASESQDSGKVLTANGSGGSAWVYPSASNFNSGSATSGQVLTANGSGGASWVTGSAGMTNPMTTLGDIIVGGASGTPARLGIGTAGQFLSVNSDASGLTWATGGGGGSTLYRHMISIYHSQSSGIINTFKINLITTQSSAFTSISSFISWLYNSGYNVKEKFLSAIGYSTVASGTFYSLNIGCYATATGTTLGMWRITNILTGQTGMSFFELDISTATITDNVVQIS